MTEREIYDRAINILDNFLGESFRVIETIPPDSNWKEQLINKLFKQSSHLVFALLSHSDKSKYQSDTYVSDIILIGALGRIIRDIYVNIIYLKTDIYSEKDMRAVWDFQVLYQKLNLIQFEDVNNYTEQRKQLENERDSLQRQIEAIMFSTRGRVLDGKEEKLLSLKELAEIKQFHKGKFNSEFEFFSQFSHSTAFANHFTKSEGIPLNIIAATYDRIVAYFVGIVAESIDLLLPDHKDLPYLQKQYKDIIANRWNVIHPCE